MKSWSRGRVLLGIDELKSKIAGKRIALMMNTSALDHDGNLLIDRIVQDWKADVAFLFGMEHGVRGNLMAADSSLAAVDEVTGLPIVNLYKYPKLAPPPEEIAKVDAVVFSAQDVGIRHWTYTPWMLSLMDSAAKVGKEVIVVDRPNPIRGDIVSGNCTETEYECSHLLNGFGYPLRHGMTIGEIALMYNEVRSINCRLTVCEMSGYRRDMWYQETGLPWLPPSPNIPTADSPLYFGATGLLQASNVSFGRGTTTPFQYFGAPWMDGDRVAKILNGYDLPGVFCVPKFYLAQLKTNTELCNGVMLVISDRNVFDSSTTQLYIMDTLCQEYPGQFRLVENGDLGFVRMGTKKILDAAENGRSLLTFVDEWKNQSEAFKTERKDYLIYD